MFFYSEQEAQQTIATEGLVLHLDAGDTNSYPGTGTTWYDLSGNGNNGTLVNGVGYDNIDGGSLSFDGSNDYVDLTQTIQFNTSDFSISGWFRSNSGNTNQKQIWNSGYNGGTPDVEIFVANLTNHLKFYIRPGSGIETTYSVDDNVWRHFAGTKTSSVMSLYVNGVLASSTSGTFTSDVDVAGVIPRIGNGLSTMTNRPFKGNMSQIVIYNKALAEAEVQQNFNATKDRFGL